MEKYKMIRKKIKQGVFAALVLSSTIATAALAADSPNYFVLTAQPAINVSNLDWMVLTQTQANSFDPAFTAAESDVKSVVMLATDKPVQTSGVYVCAYFTSSGTMNVLAVAPDQEGVTLNPA